MPDGFRVDIRALVEAAEGVNGVILDLKDNKVSDIGGPKADYGNGTLAGTVSDFCNRWEIGVQNLTNDASQVAGRLALSATTYARAERKNVALVSGILRGSGSDPAAPQW